jgi:hypothetical protein
MKKSELKALILECKQELAEESEAPVTIYNTLQNNIALIEKEFEPILNISTYTDTITRSIDESSIAFKMKVNYDGEKNIRDFLKTFKLKSVVKDSNILGSLRVWIDLLDDK